MKKRIEFEASHDDLGIEKVNVIILLDNNQLDCFNNLTESTKKRVDWYKNEVHKMLRNKFNVSEIKIKI